MAISHCLSHLVVKNGTFVMRYIENIHFLSKPRHVMPQINCLEKNKPCYEGFNTHLWGF